MSRAERLHGDQLAGTAARAPTICLVSSPVIDKLVAQHATLTGQTGAVLAIFAVAALHAYVLAATIDRIARKLLQADGFVAMAAAFACLWLVPGATTTPLPILVCPDLRSGRREGLDQGS